MEILPTSKSSSSSWSIRSASAFTLSEYLHGPCTEHQLDANTQFEPLISITTCLVLVAIVLRTGSAVPIRSTIRYRNDAGGRPGDPEPKTMETKQEMNKNKKKLKIYLIFVL